MYTVTKRYGHDLGLSAVFRQHNAKGHCSKLHGYALAFAFTFTCHSLDKNGWVIDFGGLGVIREWLKNHFDHKLLVAVDDPARETLCLLREDLAMVNLVPATGCEAFAHLAYTQVNRFIDKPEYQQRFVKLVSVEVREHGANSATYYGDDIP